MIKFSPSQLVTYRRCKRMYAFQYNENLWPPSSKKQEFGTSVHKQLENWLSKGEVPGNDPAGETAKQGLKHLPVPMEDGLETEKNWVIPWNSKFCVGGYIDVLCPPNTIIDHKTTSDLKWAKKEIDLLVDEQALLYSLWAMLHFDTSNVNAKWIYYAATNPKSGNRKPKGSKVVEVTFSAHDPFFIEQIKNIEKCFVEMHEIRSKCIPGTDLPTSPESCELYEGCWHKKQGRCDDLSPEDLFGAMWEKHEKMQ